jgi:hypothetical protein
MKQNSSPSLNKRSNDDLPTTFVYIMENQAMLLMNVQKNEIHI